MPDKKSQDTVTSQPEVEPASSVGKTLKKARIERKLSLRDIELATKIRGKYLTAIEGDEPDLPVDVYTRGFVQSYANHLGLDGRDLAGRFARQQRDQPVKAAAPKPVKTRRLVLNMQLLVASGVVLGFVAIALYLIWQFSALAAPPQLAVSQPPKDQEFYGGLLDINGHATPGADILINDSPILVDGSGNFTDQLALQDGVNTIRITAKNHLGKTTTVTRNILAHVPAPEVTSAIPATTFDGVGVAIGVQSQPAFLTVKVDGKVVFKGTMLPGTNRTFKGTGGVTIDTSNAGATYLTVTNSVTAGKSLGAVGTLGEAKSDLEFAKDTVFE
jgi:hypothetical protein